MLSQKPVSFMQQHVGLFTLKYIRWRAWEKLQIRRQYVLACTLLILNILTFRLNWFSYSETSNYLILDRLERNLKKIDGSLDHSSLKVKIFHLRRVYGYLRRGRLRPIGNGTWKRRRPKKGICKAFLMPSLRYFPCFPSEIF